MNDQQALQNEQARRQADRSREEEMRKRAIESFEKHVERARTLFPKMSQREIEQLDNALYQQLIYIQSRWPREGM